MKLIPLISLVVIFFNLADATAAAGLTWNEFLNAGNIFPAHLSKSQALLGLASPNKISGANTDKILNELTVLLSRSEVIHQVYENYLSTMLDEEEVYEYRDPEREEIFKNHLVEIALQNIEYKAGRSTWYAGVTSMAHMTEEEFNDRYLMSNKDVRPHFTTPENYESINYGDVPATLDYRNNKIVTPVKDQANCGVCYAFQAVAILESAHANLTGTQLDLSEEDIRDCGALSKRGQCHGSSGYAALGYVQGQGGLPLEKDYPYHLNNETHDCTSSGLSRYANVSEFKYHDIHQDESKIIDALVGYGIPIGVSVYADPWPWNYKGGPFYAPCNKTDHAVTLVGYDDNTYFIKNSWGVKWGDKGYIYLTRGDNNCCIGNHITYITQMA